MGNGHSDTSQAAHDFLRKQSRMDLAALAKEEQWARYNEKELTLLDRMFQDLVKRSPDRNMTKEVFLDYFNLPGILGERLFDVFDTTKDGVINFDEFVCGLARYNRGTLKGKIDMLFELYDLDGEEYIAKEDLRMVLFSLVTPTTSIFYSDPSHTASGSPTLESVNDSENLFRLSEMTRKTVNHLVDDAFAQCDQDGDNQKLSRAQFRNWVTRNPAAMEVLNTEFAKHVWGGLSAATGSDKESKKSLSVINEKEADFIQPPGEKFGSAHLMPSNAGTACTTPIYGNSPEPHIADNLSSASPQVSSDALHSTNSPRRTKSLPANLIATTVLRQTPDVLVPVYENLVNQYHREMHEEYFHVFVCKKCGLKFTNSIQKGDGLAASVNAAENNEEILLLEKSNNPHLTMKYCLQCGGELEPRDFKSKIFVDLNSAVAQLSTKSIILKKGILCKIGRATSSWIERLYVLKDKFLYAFKPSDEDMPTDVLFIQGWFIEPFDDQYARCKDKSKQHFGIELQPPPTVESQSLKRYAKSKEERDCWVKILRRAASTVSLADYYTIGEVLGKGHFSVVHLGIHKATNKKVAIKVVDKNRVDAREKLSLRNEIAIMKLVKHPYIINMIEVLEDQKMIYMVMTLVEHGDLFKRWHSKLGNPKVFPEQVTKIIIWKLLDALQYLHGLGIVHRDLKPENILCTHATDDTQIMISDFGLSKFAAPHAEMTMPCGTLAYVAPEVLRMQKYDRKVDLWSLGCVMHLLLRGILPFDGKTKMEVVEKTLRKELRMNNHMQWERVSDLAKDLLSKLLQKDPKRRIDLEAAMAHPWFQDIQTEALQIHTNLNVSSFISTKHPSPPHDVDHPITVKEATTAKTRTSPVCDLVNDDNTPTQ